MFFHKRKELGPKDMIFSALFFLFVGVINSKVWGPLVVFRVFFWDEIVPSRERIHIPLQEKENHRFKSAGWDGIC